MLFFFKIFQKPNNHFFLQWKFDEPLQILLGVFSDHSRNYFKTMPFFFVMLFLLL